MTSLALSRRAFFRGLAAVALLGPLSRVPGVEEEEISWNWGAFARCVVSQDDDASGGFLIPDFYIADVIEVMERTNPYDFIGPA